MEKNQEMMIQNEKMMSLGGLATGMAHEIKNPLSAIVQNSQVLKNRLFGRIPANLNVAKACDLSFDRMETYLNKRNIGNMLQSFGSHG